jgi:flagellar basal-body rod modification protein FlgD
MYTSAIDTSPSSGVPAAQQASGSDAAAAQERFLRLLVAQINNQDPLNPMDNAQMTSQMAQISTVMGIEQLNQTLQGIAQQFGTMQGMQGASLVGRDALVEGDGLYFDDTVGRGALSLPADAEQVYVDIVGRNGEVIDTVDLGARGPGLHAFEWDAGSADVTAIDRFEVRATRAGEPVLAQALARVPVTSVGMRDGRMQLQLSNGRQLAYEQIRAFM